MVDSISLIRMIANAVQTTWTEWAPYEDYKALVDIDGTRVNFYKNNQRVGTITAHDAMLSFDIDGMPVRNIGFDYTRKFDWEVVQNIHGTITHPDSALRLDADSAEAALLNNLNNQVSMNLSLPDAGAIMQHLKDTFEGATQLLGIDRFKVEDKSGTVTPEIIIHNKKPSDVRFSTLHLKIAHHTMYVYSNDDVQTGISLTITGGITTNPIDLKSVSDTIEMWWNRYTNMREYGNLFALWTHLIYCVPKRKEVQEEPEEVWINV